jgi:hypothetical protein
MLRALYSEVANGGFGPGYGFLGVVGGAADEDRGGDLSQLYRFDRENPPQRQESSVERGQPGWFEPFYDEWPARVLRVLNWGCAIWSCLDARSGQVLRFERLQGKRTRDLMIVEADSLEQWLTRWLAGDQLWEMRPR